MAEKKYPERSRCKGCRKGLDKDYPVYRGLYCSVECGGLSPVVEEVEAAPRCCRTMRDGRWLFKVRYKAKSMIPARVKDDPSTNVYWCENCHHLHVGRTLVAEGTVPRAANRGLRSRADIADVLTKARGTGTHRVVAALAGVRPIRIKEWEDASFDNPSLNALFALCRVYRIDLAVVFK